MDGRCCRPFLERHANASEMVPYDGTAPIRLEQVPTSSRDSDVSVIRTTWQGSTGVPRRKRASAGSDSETVSDTSDDAQFRTRNNIRRYGIQSAHLPPFLRSYLDLTSERETALQYAAAAVSTAVDSAYGDQIELWSQFLLSAVEHGEIPHQPQSTPVRMLEIACEALQDGMLRLSRFASLLPGFLELSVDDQQVLVSEKYLIHWLVHHARFLIEGDFYYLAGSENVHCSRYWLEELEPDYLAYVVHFANSLNSIGLDLTETYIMLAVALFRPDTTAASDKAALVRLHTYYLDTLLFLVSKRLRNAERTIAYRKLDCLFRHLPVVQKLSTDYVRTLQMDRFPIRSATTSCRQVLTDSRSILQ